MFEELGLELGTLAFFAFSFLAGVFITLQAILGSRKETRNHRVIKAIVGVIYATVTVLAFMQLEGVKSPYVDTSALPAISPQGPEQEHMWSPRPEPKTAV